MRPYSKALYWLAALLALVVVVGYLRDALLPFVAGAIIAYFLDPLATRLQRLGVGRTLAAGLIVGMAFLALVGAALFLLPLVVAQLSQLVETLPADLERIGLWLEAVAQRQLGDRFPEAKAALERSLGELAQGSSGLLAGAAQALWSRGVALVNLLSLILVTPVVAFYLLRDWPRLVARVDSWLPRDQAATIRQLAFDIDRAVSAFVRGQGTICLILGTIYAVALTTLGLRYGLVIGIVTGLLAFVPMVGWAFGLTVALVVALSQAWPDTTLPLQVLLVYGGVMAIDSGLLSPLIVGQRVGLHPVWLMLALFVFSLLFGLLGLLVAVPVAAALAVLVRFGRDRYLDSTLYHGDAAPPPRPIEMPARLDT